MERIRSKHGIASLAVAAVVLGLSVAQAIREASLGPIWTIAWLPTVIVGGLAAPSTAKHCSVRFRPGRQE
jgi:hypothetical protein